MGLPLWTLLIVKGSSKNRDGKQESRELLLNAALLLFQIQIFFLMWDNYLMKDGHLNALSHCWMVLVTSSRS